MSDPGSKSRTRWTASRKAEVVLDLIKGANAENLARQNGISQNQLFKWRDVFLEAGKAELRFKRQKAPAEKEIGRLERKVGQLTLQVEILQDVARLKKTKLFE